MQIFAVQAVLFVLVLVSCIVVLFLLWLT